MIRKESLAQSVLFQSVCSSTSFRHLLSVNSSGTSLGLSSSNLHALTLARKVLISNCIYSPPSHPPLPSPPSWTSVLRKLLAQPPFPPLMPSLSLISPAPAQCKTSLSVSAAAAPRPSIYHVCGTTRSQALSWCKLFAATFKGKGLGGEIAAEDFDRIICEYGAVTDVPTCWLGRS